MLRSSLTGYRHMHIVRKHWYILHKRTFEGLFVNGARKITCKDSEYLTLKLKERFWIRILKKITLHPSKTNDM